MNYELNSAIIVDNSENIKQGKWYAMKEEFYLKQIPKEVEERYKEGVDKLDTGKFQEAEKIFMEVLETAGDFVPVYNKIGIKYIYENDLEKAGEWLNRALDRDPKFAPAITNLGSIEKKRRDLEKAKKYYKQAIEIDEEYGPAYNNLGVIYREEGDYGQSVKYLKKARKHGGYSFIPIGGRAFYREPGCIIPLLILIGGIILFYLWLH